MGDYAVIRGASYTLAHTPDMVIHDGATQVTERIVNPEGEYLKELPKHLRTYNDVLAYAPNQVYIGNMSSRDLETMEMPWYDKAAAIKDRKGKYGEIMPQDEYYGLMQICDVFDLVVLEAGFAAGVKSKLEGSAMFTEEQIAVLDKNQFTKEQIEALVDEDGACGLYMNNELVGAVKRAHDVDVNLSAHVMLENISSKATSVLSLLHLVRTAGINPEEVDYVIDCAEEACGDMNQRGGGNFAKAAAEIAGLSNATGCDVRGFCAGPAHAILNAAALVKSGTFKNVVVTAGGCTAKLGMNGKSHVEKNMPILEDCLAGFAVLISEDNGVDPIIRSDITGRHKVGTGSSPQAVISSLVTDPLDEAGLSIKDVDKYAPEMQNPDITKPAGAGDVPESNYKMIAALGVKRGDLEKSELGSFITDHGMKGWAPTQGHIPSGVPFMGSCRDMMLEGDISRAMIIGKGSLFLGRMTNLFDGVSFVIEANKGQSSDKSAGAGSGVSETEVRSMIAGALKDFAAGLLAE
ncbi:MAG: glycine reductase [Mogibacterium sp.]|nr:glycine reductase [Mogibacterium sp.]